MTRTSGSVIFRSEQNLYERQIPRVLMLGIGSHVQEGDWWRVSSSQAFRGWMTFTTKPDPDELVEIARPVVNV